MHHDNLLLSHSRKRYYSSGSSDDGDMSDETEVVLTLGGPGSAGYYEDDFTVEQQTLLVEQQTQSEQSAVCGKKPDSIEDCHREENESDKKIIGTSLEMGAKVSEALDNLGLSDRAGAIQTISSQIDGLEDTMNTSNVETQGMLMMI